MSRRRNQRIEDSDMEEPSEIQNRPRNRRLPRSRASRYEESDTEEQSQTRNHGGRGSFTQPESLMSRRRTNRPDDDRDFEGQSHSRVVNERGAFTQPEAFSDERQKELTTDMVKYILNSSSTKLPIKRSDLVKNVLNGQANRFQLIFQDAILQLQKVSLSNDVKVKLISRATILHLL